jgi:hypothetical protein
MTPPTAHRPNRILIALAAAWMIVALAFGGTVTAETRSSASSAVTTHSAAIGQP